MIAIGDFNLLSPEFAVVVRTAGLIIGALLALLTGRAFAKHPTKESFWDFVASCVVSVAFVALLVSTVGGMAAVSGNVDLHRALVVANLIITTMAILGVITLVVSWHPAKEDR